MLGRLVRVLKLLRFVRLLKGLRLVKMFRRQFVTVSPGKFACKSPSGTFFSLFANTAFDTSGDGLLSFAELKTAMRINQLMVSNHLLASIYQEIYKVQTQRELLFDNTFHTAYTEPEDRTIQLAAVLKQCMLDVQLDQMGKVKGRIPTMDEPPERHIAEQFHERQHIRL